jgi:hypothetical protein
MVHYMKDAKNLFNVKSRKNLSFFVGYFCLLVFLVHFLQTAMQVWSL